MENEQGQFSSSPSPAPSTPVQELQANYESLNRLVKAVLLLMVVVTGTMCLFFRKQAKIVGIDLANYQTQTTNMVAQYKKSEPMVDDLLRKFQDFGRTNPDFQPYLAKYGITANTPFGKAAVTNRPAATVSKKK